MGQRRPDQLGLARLDGAPTLSEQGLGRLRAKRERLLGSLNVERPDPVPPGAEQHLGSALISERLGQLCRRQIAAGRLQPSAMVEETLGECPSDPDRAHLWNEGVNTIYSYCHRHGISSRSTDPLGAEPLNSSRGEEWLAAQRRLQQIQVCLGVSAEMTRTIEQAASIEL